MIVGFSFVPLLTLLFELTVIYNINTNVAQAQIIALCLPQQLSKMQRLFLIPSLLYMDHRTTEI